MHTHPNYTHNNHCFLPITETLTVSFNSDGNTDCFLLPPTETLVVSSFFTETTDCFLSITETLTVFFSFLTETQGYLPKEPERRLTTIMDKLKGEGIQASNVVVVGHSGGAFLSYDTALTKSQVRS